MRNLLSLFAVMMLLFTSCSKEEIKSSLSERVSYQISKAVISELECSNVKAVMADMKAMTDKVLKVQSKGTKVVSGAVSTKSIDAQVSAKVVICKTITKAMMPLVMTMVKSGKMKAWQCKVEKGEQALMDLITKGCDKLASNANKFPPLVSFPVKLVLFPYNYTASSQTKYL